MKKVLCNFHKYAIMKLHSIRRYIEMTWFNKQSRLVQLLLLLIPGVNWVVELMVRWGTWLKRGGLLRLIICLVVTVAGLVVGWIDFIWVLLFKRFFLQ